MPNKSTQDGDAKQPIDPDVALKRLIYVVVIGCLLILAYGLRYVLSGGAGFLVIVSVGMMAGGAALLSGGLLGFLFGVPHTFAGEAGQTNQETSKSASDRQREVGSGGPSTSYRPNTGLEQISDWLTKMLIGVGLIEIKVIPGKLTTVAAYIAKGLGNGEQAEAFALTILIYFSVCGFVFGFLWARLYLPRWFREADEVQILAKKVSQLEKQQEADAAALTLINQQINRQADDPLATDQEVAEAIKASSDPVRIQIFYQAKKVSESRKSDDYDYDVKIPGVISVLKGLIACDTKNRYHRNHSELSNALYHREPPDLQGAKDEITKAIDIRDRLGKKGWKYYEFHRARCRIKLDPNLEKEQIAADLKAAESQTDKWKRWLDSQPKVQEWMKINSNKDAEPGNPEPNSQ